MLCLIHITCWLSQFAVLHRWLLSSHWRSARHQQQVVSSDGGIARQTGPLQVSKTLRIPVNLHIDSLWLLIYYYDILGRLQNCVFYRSLLTVAKFVRCSGNRNAVCWREWNKWQGRHRRWTSDVIEWCNSANRQNTVPNGDFWCSVQSTAASIELRELMMMLCWCEVVVLMLHLLSVQICAWWVCNCTSCCSREVFHRRADPRRPGWNSTTHWAALTWPTEVPRWHAGLAASGRCFGAWTYPCTAQVLLEDWWVWKQFLYFAVCISHPLIMT